MEPTPTLAVAMLDLLKALGVNQNAIAAKLHVTRGQVSHWRRGVRPIPHEHVDALSQIIETVFDEAVDAPDWPLRKARVEPAWRAYRQSVVDTMERLSPGAGMRSLLAKAEHEGRVICDAMSRGPASWSVRDRVLVSVAAKLLSDTVTMMNLLLPLERKAFEEGINAEDAETC